MRTSVLGIPQFYDLDAVAKNTKEICTVTHADPRCSASCIAVTVAIALMLQGETDLDKIHSTGTSVLQQYSLFSCIQSSC